MSFWGYRRANGTVGSRNLVGILSTVTCANDVTAWIADRVEGAAPFLHGQGCAGTRPDLVQTTRTLISLGWPTLVKMLVGGLAAALPAVMMGTFFPPIFARVERARPTLASVCWLSNGAAAVAGSFAILYGAMLFGMRAMAFVAWALYALLTLWDAAKTGGWRRAPDAGVLLALAALAALGVVSSEIVRPR